MREGSKKITRQEYGFLPKDAILKRLLKSTKATQELGMKNSLKKLGFSEVSIEEIQDRLSKSRRSLSQDILLDREQV